MAFVLGEMDVVQVNPYWSEEGIPSALGLVRTTTVRGGHPIPEARPGGPGGRH